MVLLGNTQFQNTIFKCESTFVPAKSEEPEYEEEDHKEDGLVFIPPLCNYLPGERLLQKVNKKAKKKRRENNLSIDEVSTITRAMSKIMSQVS